MNSSVAIQKAAQILSKGGVVAIPTETVYGLAANALNPQAVSKIFDIKKRPRTSPLIVHAATITQVTTTLATLPLQAKKLAQTYWPGPLTLLLPKHPQIPNIVTANTQTVGVRIPKHPLTQALLKTLPFPLAAPSANPFGYISPTTAQHVKYQLGSQVDYILDGGPTSYGLESTIVGFPNQTPHLYRLGSITQESIEQTLGHPISYQKTTRQQTQQEAPGRLDSHYAPSVPLQLGIPSQFTHYTPHQVGILAFDQYIADIPKKNQFLLSPNRSLKEAARRFFAGLHYLDSLPITHIFTNYLPEEGLGKAINDRLRRAAHPKG